MKGSLMWLEKKLEAKRGLLVILAIVLAINLAGVATVFAVHEDFELEGNTAPGDLVTGPDLDAAGVDWESLFDVSAGVATPKATLPSGFGPASFIRDFQGTVEAFSSEDTTVFATGSKDTKNIGGGGWQCKTANNVLNQDDLMNVYATAFRLPTATPYSISEQSDTVTMELRTLPSGFLRTRRLAVLPVPVQKISPVTTERRSLNRLGILQWRSGQRYQRLRVGRRCRRRLESQCYRLRSRLQG